MSHTIVLFRWVDGAVAITGWGYVVLLSLAAMTGGRRK